MRDLGRIPRGMTADRAPAAADTETAAEGSARLESRSCGTSDDRARRPQVGLEANDLSLEHVGADVRDLVEAPARARFEGPGILGGLGFLDEPVPDHPLDARIQSPGTEL